MIRVPQPDRTDLDQQAFKWQQSLVGFERIVQSYTARSDVICDPCMGSGTTLLAAARQHRTRVIGMEQDASTYAIAHARLTTAGLVPGGQGSGRLSTPEETHDPTAWQQLELAPSA